MSKFVSIQSKIVGVSGCVVSSIVRGLKAEPMVMIWNISKAHGRVRFGFGLIVNDDGTAQKADRATMADLVQLWYDEFGGVDHLFPQEQEVEVIEEVAATTMEEPMELEIPPFLLAMQERRRQARYRLAF